MNTETFKNHNFVDLNDKNYSILNPYYNAIMENFSHEDFVINEIKKENFSNDFIRKFKNVLFCLASNMVISKSKEESLINYSLSMFDYALFDNSITVSDKFKNFVKELLQFPEKFISKQKSSNDEIIDTIAEIVSDNPKQKGFEDSPEGALATYANNMAFIPPYHSMHQQVLPQPQQTIPQSQQAIPPIQQQMVLLNKPDIVDVNYSLKYDLRDINEINNLTTRINKVFANPEILEFINKFKFINKFYVAEYKKDEFTLMAPTSTSYVYIKVLSDGDYKVAEIPFKPN